MRTDDEKQLHTVSTTLTVFIEVFISIQCTFNIEHSLHRRIEVFQVINLGTDICVQFTSNLARVKVRCVYA